MKTTTPERKSAKTLKGQLFGAVSMMLVAAIALGTSTYAWFINNQAVEVQNMNLTVSTATSLLAAVGKPASVTAYNTTFAANNYTSFKTTITSEDISGDGTKDFGGWTNIFNTAMAPASVCDDELQQAFTSTAFPTFFKSLDQLKDGKVSQFEALTHDTADTSFSGLGQGPVKHIRLAMMGSAADLDVYLGEAGADENANTLDISTLVATSTQTSLPNNGTVNGVVLADQAVAIRSALRIAIVPVASTGSATAATFQFDDGTGHFTGLSGNNTYYATTLADAITADESTGVYRAVKAVDGSSKEITTAAELNATLPLTNKYVAAVAKAADGTLTVTPGTTPLFTLTANEEQIVDIYIWLEGTDQDCINALSAYHFDLRLPFVAAPKITTP